MITSIGNFNVIRGPAAIRCGGPSERKNWMDFSSGNRATGIWRASANVALKDAEKKELKP